MYENIIFGVGFWVGYWTLWVFLSMVFLIKCGIDERRWNKYLRETKQHQTYEDWKFKNRISYKFVKSK